MEVSIRSRLRFDANWGPLLSLLQDGKTSPHTQSPRPLLVTRVPASATLHCVLRVSEKTWVTCLPFIICHVSSFSSYLESFLSLFQTQRKTLLRGSGVCFWPRSRANFPAHGQSLRHAGGQILNIRFKIFFQWACCLRHSKHALFNNVPFDSCDLNICSHQQSFDPCFVSSRGLISLGYFSLELGESRGRAALGSVEKGNPAGRPWATASRGFYDVYVAVLTSTDWSQKISFRRLL